MFTAVVLCMDDDLLVPPADALVGELVTVKGHPPTPSKNSTAVSMIWEKVLNEELFQVGDDEVRRPIYLHTCTAQRNSCHIATKIKTSTSQGKGRAQAKGTRTSSCDVPSV